MRVISPDSNFDIFDICIIGGGVNGCGVARDAAGRGYRTLLLEQNDLASSTSSKSTKLIHGGLRYLEQFEFRLVHESLQERNHLIRIAPHIITPLSFVLPHESYIRPYWLVRLGLFIYDALGINFEGSAFHRSKGVSLAHNESYGAPLKNRDRKALLYSDGWVDDSRLVALNARDAALRGAVIKTYEPCLSIESHNHVWHIITPKGRYKAKCIVNASGPWVRELLMRNNLSHVNTPQVRLVKGSHIIVPRLYDGDHAYILQQSDKRVVFAIPYQDKYTLVGTTEKLFDGDPHNPQISDQEIDYLFDIINTTFKANVKRYEIISTYSGVRALYDDHATEQRTITRDYKITEDQFASRMVISIFGGKITTYRALAQHVMHYADEYFERENKDWTLSEPLPGGDEAPAFILSRIQEEFPDIEAALAKRLVSAYGTDALTILHDDSKTFIAPHVLKSELDFTIKHEFVKNGDDYLWRRSKMGLHLPSTEQNTISKYILSATHP